MTNPSPAPSPEELAALGRWQTLEDHINYWFYDMDLEALRIALAVGVSHFFSKDPPVWLMVLGPSSSGKTEILIRAVNALPGAMEVHALTTNTLLSAHGKGDVGLLTKLGTAGNRSGILTFPELGVIMSMREETRREIMGQLRAVYDGSYTKHSGQAAATDIRWQGKVTVVAACVPAIERHWSDMKELGERFVTMRWARGDGIEQAKAAYKQARSSDPEAIKAEISRLAALFVDIEGIKRMAKGGLLPSIPEEHTIPGLAPLTEMIAVLRCPVIRSDNFKREIVSLPVPEGTGRITKQILQIARAHACLFRHEVRMSDFLVARRVALDSIQGPRSVIYQALTKGPHTASELTTLTGLPSAMVISHGEDLQVLKVVDITDNGVERRYALTSTFQDLRTKAKSLEEA